MGPSQQASWRLVSAASWTAFYLLLNGGNPASPQPHTEPLALHSMVEARNMSNSIPLSILGTNEPALKVTDMSPSLAEDPEVYYGEKTEASSSGSLTDICAMSWEMQ